MENNEIRRTNEQVDYLDADNKQKEYIDIISALAEDVTGLYVIDRNKREVTAYRISESDRRIRSGVPLDTGFETAMGRFIKKIVHPDDRALLSRSAQIHFMEKELSDKRSFRVRFRSLKDGAIQVHSMKCIRNRESADYDKIIISFSPEENMVSSKRAKASLKPNVDRKAKTILIAEDQEQIRQQLYAYLSDEYCILEAGDGIRALEMLDDRYKDISAVLYDERLPKADAPTFLERIKKDVFLSSIPVIVMTDNKDEDMVNRCESAGAAEFVVKPLRSVVLKSRIRQVINMRLTSDALEAIENDDLTGLYTKQAFFYHAKTMIDASPNESFTIAISDIQNFKIYNSVHGQEKGDVLLRILGEYLVRTINTGVCARYGADQFIVILKTPTEEQILRYVARVQEFVNENCSENVVLKFGIYENLDRTLDIVRICDRALIALKSTKGNYDRSYAYFDGAESQRHYKAQVYEAQFYRAIENQEFVVWYQPKYNPYTNKVVGAEALVRWRLSDGTMVRPYEFLPVFEEDGLIGRLDEYIFRKVCEHQKKWKDMGKDLIPISVNLSRNSMHRLDVVKCYKEIADEYGISPNMLPIEITESAAVETIKIKPLADAFFEMGFPLHMDDFGSGKSSLTGLNLLHFDVLKLDKSLIDYIGDEHGNLVLMYAIAMSKELGLYLVAEGVETADQLEYLKENGCDAIQGYYYSCPLPEDEFEELVRDNLETGVVVHEHRHRTNASDGLMKRAMNRILHRMPGGFLTYRRDDHHIISSNQYLWALFGCEDEMDFMTYVGGSFLGMVCSEDLERVERYIEKQLKEGYTDMDYVEYDIVRKDGKRLSVVDYGYLDHQYGGDIFYVFISEADKKSL